MSVPPQRNALRVGTALSSAAQAQAYELFLASDCSIETAEHIEAKVDNVAFVRPGAHSDAAAQSLARAGSDGANWYCVYEFDMDSHTFLPLRTCFSLDRLPSLPPSLRSPGAFAMGSRRASVFGVLGGVSNFHNS